MSKGPERFPMPVVVGLSQAAAEVAIEKAKLSVGKVADGYSDQVAAGTVLRASEKQGARLKKGTAINLVVCAGPKPVSITDYQGTRTMRQRPSREQASRSSSGAAIPTRSAKTSCCVRIRIPAMRLAGKHHPY